MAKMLLVNPRKRRAAGHRRKGHRTAAQKAATRKMIAANRARRKDSHTKRRRRRTTVKATRSHRSYRRNPVVRRSYRRNPAKMKFNLKSIINSQLKPAAIMASGALALDVVFGYIGDILPATLTSHPMVKNATKGVFAIGLAMMAENVVKRDTANKLALGALTVTLHDTLKTAMGDFAPSIPLDGVGWASPGYIGPGMGYYESLPAPNSALGYYEQTGGSLGEVNSESWESWS